MRSEEMIAGGRERPEMRNLRVASGRVGVLMLQTRICAPMNLLVRLDLPKTGI